MLFAEGAPVTSNETCVIDINPLAPKAPEDALVTRIPHVLASVGSPLARDSNSLTTVQQRLTALLSKVEARKWVCCSEMLLPAVNALASAARNGRLIGLAKLLNEEKQRLLNLAVRFIKKLAALFQGNSEVLPIIDACEKLVQEDSLSDSGLSADAEDILVQLVAAFSEHLSSAIQNGGISGAQLRELLCGEVGVLVAGHVLVRKVSAELGVDIGPLPEFRLL